jgi:hypothetical protein
MTDYNKLVKINNQNYDLVDVQRGGSAIYKNGSTYLRIGSKEKIEVDLALHKKMETFGFPVAKLISEGEHEGLQYFIEESLGEDCFGRIFKKETEQSGYVSDKSFEIFLDIALKFATAQLKTASAIKDWESFRKGIHLDIICQELPDEKEKILKRYQQIEERLDAFPFGILHGDFTPFNIYPKGIIDLEDSFQGPIGYDIGALPELQTWFPETSDDEFYRVYKFTPEQRTRLIESVDNVYINQNLPKISGFQEDFDFTKGIWFAVRMQHLPKLQQFRYEILRNLIS